MKQIRDTLSVCQKRLLTASQKNPLQKKRYVFLARVPSWGWVSIVAMSLVVIGIGSWQWHVQQQYVLSPAAKKLVGGSRPELVKKLAVNKQDNFVFNKQAHAVSQRSGAKEKVGAGGDTLYSLDISRTGKTTYRDANTDLNFSLVPQFNSREGKQRSGHLVFPLKKGSQMVYSLKSNGLKEDIIYDEAPASGEARFTYKLELLKTLEARQLEDGSIGIYSANPLLFSGNMTFGDNADKLKIQHARQTAPKDYLVFGIPAPVIKAASGDQGKSWAKFELKNNRLTLRAGNLQSIDGAFTIDPSVVVTSSSDFEAGSNEGGIDFPAGAIERSGLSGGIVESWQSGTSLPQTLSSGELVAHGNYAYYIGGFDGSSYVADVYYAPINGDGSIGSWTATASLNGARSDYAAVAYNGYVYALGGYNGTSSLSSVEYAEIQSDGSLGAWQTTTSLPANTSGLGVVVSGGYIHILGGYYSGEGPSSDTYSAAIKADGTLGSWQAATSLPGVRHDFGYTQYNGYAYVVGGSDGSSAQSTVYYAKLGTDGTIGSWQAATSLSSAREDFDLVAQDGYLYTIGGYDGSVTLESLYTPVYASGEIGVWQSNPSYPTTVRYVGATAYKGYVYGAGGSDNSSTVLADVNYGKVAPAGSTGAYQSTNTFSTSRRGADSVVFNGYIYIVGGYDGASDITDVQYAPINADGSVGTWSTTTSLPWAKSWAAATTYNGYMYVTGGFTSGTRTTDVAYAPISGDGTIGTWTTTTSFATGRGGHRTVAHNGYLYIMGGHIAGAYSTNDVQYAPINRDGSVDTWQATTSFPNDRDTPGMAVYDGRIYLAGGYDFATSTAYNDVVYASFNDDGTLSAWTTDPNTFANARARSQSVIHNGKLYVIGGDDGGSTTYYDDVQFATIQNDGSLGAWQTSSMAFSIARSGHASVVARGNLYMLGGHDGSNVYNTVMYAALNNGGSGEAGFAGAWSGTSSFTTARNGHATVTYNGYLYVLGGWNGSSYYNDVQYAPISDDGTVGAYQSTSSFTTGRNGFGAAIHNGYIYIAGGNGGKADVQYAPINSDGTIGTWQVTTSLPNGRENVTLEAHNGNLYAVGGSVSGTPLGNTIYAPINSDGTVGSWQAATDIPAPKAQGANMILRYSLEGPIDSSVEDYSGNNINGTVTNGGSIVTGYDGKNAYNFDGVDDYISIPDDTRINTGGPYAERTVSLWFKADDVTTRQVLFKEGGASRGLGIYLYNGNVYVAGWNEINDDSTTPWPGGIVTQSTSVSTGTWHHVVLRFDANADELRGFLNGSSFGAANGVGNLFNHSANNSIAYADQATCFEDGTCPSGSGYPYDGAVDEVRLYDDAVTNDEIKILADDYYEIQNHSSTVYNGYLYAIGGNAGQRPGRVLYAPINSGGSLGSWSVTRSLPVFEGLAYHSSIAHNGYLYVLGGLSGPYADSNYSSMVFRAPIHANGSVGEWRKTASLPTASFWGTAAAHNGYIYSTGGRYGGGYVNETNYLPLQSISRVGDYTKLIDFGITNAALANITYTGDLPGGVDAIEFQTAGSDGIFEARRSGSTAGDNLPTGECAVSNTQYIQLFATLNDTDRAVFPDSQGSLAILNDITVDYQVIDNRSPSDKRLRGGKWFNQEQLQPLDTCGN